MGITEALLKAQEESRQSAAMSFRQQQIINERIAEVDKLTKELIKYKTFPDRAALLEQIERQSNTVQKMTDELAAAMRDKEQLEQLSRSGLMDRSGLLGFLRHLFSLSGGVHAQVSGMRPTVREIIEKHASMACDMCKRVLEIETVK